MAKKLGGKKPKVSKSKLKDTKLIIGLCAVLALIVFFAVLFLLRQVVQTETYYVLSEDLGPRTLVTPEHLESIVTQEGSAPPTALSRADIENAPFYTQYPMQSGDVLLESAVGGLDDIQNGIPDEWVVTNFGVPADHAVGGRLQRGSYFDMIGINSENEAFYIFSNMMVLDTSVSMTGASSADAIDTEEASAGQTEQYYVGLSPENAALLHSAIREYDIRLVMAPRQNEDNDPQVDRMQGYFYYDPAEIQDVPVVGGVYEGERLTDETFRSGREQGDDSEDGESNLTDSGESESGQDIGNISQNEGPQEDTSSEDITDDNNVDTDIDNN